MSTVRVLEDVPELGWALEGEALSAARRAAAREARVPVGPVDWESWAPPGEAAYGILVLDGLLLRELRVIGACVCTELLGAGDLLRPWTDGDEFHSIPAEADWDCAVDARVAVLDRRFSHEVARWPSVAAALLDKPVQRSRSMHFQLAVCHLPRVEDRLLVLFWHLADRYGRVTTGGVRLPLPLPHRTLASLVGARRPSVTTALGGLREEGLVERIDGGWVLHGDAPEVLHRIRRESALPPPRRPAR